MPIHRVSNVRIKRRLNAHLQELGFVRDRDQLIQPPTFSKETFRQLHEQQRDEVFREQSNFISSRTENLFSYFASGRDVVPENIRPHLELVEAGTEASDLFRLAGLTWSIPVSQGYGRRIRFLVKDQQNGKLIGLIALGDPVFNSRVRDREIGWNAEERKDRLVGILDAFVLGAVPPYNFLLGGKLVSCLIRSTEVRDIFDEKYGDYRGIISGKRKNARLVMVTTSSALGRSSVYNRLKLNNIEYFKSIGFTQGWGHFHIPRDLFEEMRRYLESIDHDYANGHKFGSGPNWRMRVVRASLERMKLNPDLLKHGIEREVFMCRLASNADRYLKGEIDRPRYSDLLSTEQISDLALDRWILPRAHSNSEWRDWDAKMIQASISETHTRVLNS